MVLLGMLLRSAAAMLVHSKASRVRFDFFLNRRYSLLLSFGGPQLYNWEALPFTYGQYVVIELADKLYNSVTVCFCASQKYVFHIGLKREPNVD